MRERGKLREVAESVLIYELTAWTGHAGSPCGNS